MSNTSCTCSNCSKLVPMTHMVADWDNDLIFCVDCAIVFLTIDSTILQERFK